MLITTLCSRVKVQPCLSSRVHMWLLANFRWDIVDFCSRVPFSSAQNESKTSDACRTSSCFVNSESNLFLGLLCSYSPICEYLKRNLRCNQSGLLARPIIRRADLDNVGTDNVQAF